MRFIFCPEFVEKKNIQHWAIYEAECNLWISTYIMLQQKHAKKMSDDNEMKKVKPEQALTKPCNLIHSKDTCQSDLKAWKVQPEVVLTKYCSLIRKENTCQIHLKYTRVTWDITHHALHFDPLIRLVSVRPKSMKKVALKLVKNTHPILKQICRLHFEERKNHEKELREFSPSPLQILEKPLKRGCVPADFECFFSNEDNPISILSWLKNVTISYID